MKKSIFLFYLFIIALFTIIISCNKDEQEYETISKTSPVKADLALVPYQKLTDYNFFDGEIL